MIIEKTVIDYLNNVLNVKAYAQRPETEPESYVLIEKTGESCLNKVYTATIAVQSYAPTLFEAAQLNEAIINTLDGIAELDEIGSCKLSTDYNFTNTQSKRYRYQAIFNLVHI